MKKFITFLLAAASAFTIHAQQEAPPQGINYQAVALDNSGKETVGVDLTTQPVAQKEIRVRFSILKTSENGSLTYREQHVVTTDSYGLFNSVIGQGLLDSSPNNFNQIDWGTGYHFLKVEIDIMGGTNYKDMGTQQLWSVPYALHSKYASVAGNGIDSVTDNGNRTITFTYIDGSTYTTPTLTGLTGPQGEIGPQGPAGTDGQNGSSAYQIWLSQGNTGTEADFLNSLVGAQGTQGIQGPIGATGPQGPPGIAGIAGTNGLDGNGITSTIDNGNGTFTINYSNGTSFTTSNLTGAQGIQGPNGAAGSQGPQGIQGIAGTNGLDGNGITSALDNGNGTFTINYSNGTSFTTSNLTGPQGIQGIEGTNGLDGNGITSTIDNGNGTFTINYSNGTSFTTSNLTGPQGIQGPIGPQGPAGANGQDGLSAYEIWLAEGNTGTETDFLTGITGSQGVTGAQGPQGIQGEQGIQGIPGSLDAWSLTGNAGTNPSSNFIGTTDSKDWLVKTNNYENIRVTSSGNVGIGTINPFNISLSPLSKFHVYTHENFNYAARIENGGGSGKGLLIRASAGSANPPLLHVQDNLLNDRFVVLGMGNVGIGNGNPLDKLHLTGGGIRIDGSYGIGFNSCPPSDTILNEGARIYWKEIPSFGASKDYFVFEKTDANGPDPDGGFLFVNTGNDYVKSYSMMINGNGNVGIGTITPARTLHVNAVMRLEPIPTAPASPAKGDIYFDSVINKLRVYDGSVWQNCW